MKDLKVHKLYDETIEVEFRGGVRHSYKKDGKAILGVTTMINILAKPDLLGWAAWEASQAFMTAVTPFVKANASCTLKELKQLAGEARKAHTRKSDKGKDVGTIAHEWIRQETIDGPGKVTIPQYSLDLIDEAKTEDEKQLIKDNTNAAHHPVQLWRRWLEDYDVEIIKSEVVVYSKELDYAGTVDVIFYSHRLKMQLVGDYKTSEPQKVRNSKFVVTGHKAYPEHFAQCTAYDHAHNEEFPDFEVGAYAVIYLPKDTKSDYFMFTREEVELDRQGWKHLVGTYRWIQDIKRKKKE